MPSTPTFYGNDDKPALDGKEQTDYVEDVNPGKHADVEDDVAPRRLGNATGIATAMYAEALEKYGSEGSIDPAKEKKLVR